MAELGVEGLGAILEKSLQHKVSFLRIKRRTLTLAEHGVRYFWGTGPQDWRGELLEIQREGMTEANAGGQEKLPGLLVTSLIVRDRGQNIYPIDSGVLTSTLFASRSD